MGDATSMFEWMMHLPTTSSLPRVAAEDDSARDAERLDD
jgi:hypothetical protein